MRSEKEIWILMIEGEDIDVAFSSRELALKYIAENYDVVAWDSQDEAVSNWQAWLDDPIDEEDDWQREPELGLFAVNLYEED